MIRKSVRSSNVASIGYDLGLRILEVQFLSGAIYQYLKVPESLYHRLMEAPSKGSFLNEYVKNAGFRYVQIC